MRLDARCLFGVFVVFLGGHDKLSFITTPQLEKEWWRMCDSRKKIHNPLPSPPPPPHGWFFSLNPSIPLEFSFSRVFVGPPPPHPSPT